VSGPLREGSSEQLDRLAGSLRQSPLRPPSFARAVVRRGIRVLAPVSIVDVDTDIDAVVMDASADMSAWARQRDPVKSRVVQASLHQLPLRAQAVIEFVVPAYTLQTLGAPGQVLEEIKRVLTPGIGSLRTWWLLWPAPAQAAEAERSTVSSGIRSVYRLTADSLTIARHDLAGDAAAPLQEQWNIGAIRRSEVDALMRGAGFRRLSWVADTGTAFDGLIVGEVEGHA
jgi:hypothetical protein